MQICVLAPETGYTRGLQEGLWSHDISHLRRKIPMQFFICNHMLSKKHSCNFFLLGNHGVLAPETGYTRGLQGGLLNHDLSHLPRKGRLHFFICHHMLLKNIFTTFYFGESWCTSTCNWLH